MLKIKDNIKLEELEKYGFKRGEIPNTICKGMYKDQFEECLYLDLYIAYCSRTLFIKELDDETNDNLDILYDLIQAGLVEKVNE